MKFKGVFLLMIALAVLASCKKDENVEAYLRGGNSIVAAGNGDMVIAGYDIADNGNYDALLMKVDMSGSILWKKYFGSDMMDGFADVIHSTDGGFVVTGFFTSSADSRTKMLVLKTNPDGVEQWSEALGSTSIARGFSTVATKDNGFVSCGFIQDDSQSDRDILLVKLNASGGKVWEKTFGSAVDEKATGKNFDEAFSIMQAQDSGFYVTGSWKGYASCCSSAFLMKVNASGDSLWTKTFDFTKGISLANTSDGGVVVSGITDANAGNIVLLKTDASGNIGWSKTIGTSGYEFSSKCIHSAGGGFAVAGVYNKSGDSNQDVMLIKFDENGGLLWTQYYGGDNVEQGYGLIQMEDGGYSITGMSNTDGSYVFLNRTDASGNELWRKSLK
jgi:hypothetical protein